MIAQTTREEYYCRLCQSSLNGATIFSFGFGFILLCVRLHFDVVYNGQETHSLRTQSVKNIRMTRTNSAKFTIELPFFPVDYLIYMQNGFNEQVSEEEVFSFIYKNLYQPS